MLSMSNAKQHNPFRHPVAAQFLSDDPAGRRGFTQQLGAPAAAVRQGTGQKLPKLVNLAYKAAAQLRCRGELMMGGTWRQLLRLAQG